MNTLGWLFILAGIVIARQVSKGRVMNLSEDLGDAFIAVVSGDTDGLSGVLARTGESATPTAADVAIANLTAGVTEGTTSGISAIAGGIGEGFQQLKDGIGNLALAAMILGERAKGYRWAATGPDYYDCSGLMWRAAQGIGYKGARFTTADIRSRKEFKLVTAGDVNDIVLWPAGSGGITGHMGVITGANKFYSARSVRSGIGESPINTFRKTKPLYLRYVGPRGSVDPFSGTYGGSSKSPTKGVG